MKRSHRRELPVQSFVLREELTAEQIHRLRFSLRTARTGFGECRSVISGGVGLDLFDVFLQWHRLLRNDNKA